MNGQPHQDQRQNILHTKLYIYETSKSLKAGKHKENIYLEKYVKLK